MMVTSPKEVFDPKKAEDVVHHTPMRKEYAPPGFVCIGNLLELTRILENDGPADPQGDLYVATTL